MNLKNTALVIAFALPSLAVLAQPQPPAVHAKAPLPTKLRFLAPGEIDPARILPAPPKDGSEAQQREMAGVENLIHTRSKERHEQAMWDAQHEDPTPFAAVIGPKFDLTKLPATAKLLDDVLHDQTVVTSQAKDYFKRRFPIAAGSPGDAYREWTCDVEDRKPAAYPLRSYPSGHSTMAYTFGVVLADLIPEKAQAILARSASYAYSREICGDHYHSDVEAGHVLGTTLGVVLLRNAALQPEIAAAKVELKAAGIAE
ncbi:MAG TPA: phosphatase PAP2 family protein [Granulicella sp.]|nr:phosphatase PAP2 family protein [Granulicella sp.]